MHEAATVVAVLDLLRWFVCPPVQPLRRLAGGSTIVSLDSGGWGQFAASMSVHWGGIVVADGGGRRRRCNGGGRGRGVAGIPVGAVGTRKSKK